MVEAGVVYIGKKPTMNYVLAVVTHFNDGSREVIVKARGRSISRAVDVAEIVRERFNPDAEVRDVRISTEKVASEQGAGMNVSSIEIVLSKGTRFRGKKFIGSRPCGRRMSIAVLLILAIAAF